MAQEAVGYRVRGQVAELLLEREGGPNVLSFAVLEALQERVRQALAEEGVRVLLLGHTGKVFCAGADLREQLGSKAGPAGLAPLLGLLMDSPKPVVCRLAGPARAGGVGLVAACDIAIAGHSANFATGEVRLGLTPALLAVPTLPKLGRAAAARLFLTGAVISAEEAERVGLIARAVADEELEGAVEETLGQLLEAEPKALAEAKRVLQLVPLMERDRALQEMSELTRRIFASAPAQEGMRSFLEHRTPSWRQS